MTLRLTPEIARAAYDLLALTLPFSRWKLPPSDAVKFRINKSADKRGEYQFGENGHTIIISEASNGHTASMIATMAHELIHLHQMHNRTPGHKSDHGEEFKRLSLLVCKHHGFDPKLF